MGRTKHKRLRGRTYIKQLARGSAAMVLLWRIHASEVPVCESMFFSNMHHTQSTENVRRTFDLRNFVYLAPFNPRRWPTNHQCLRLYERGEKKWVKRHPFHSYMADHVRNLF